MEHKTLSIRMTAIVVALSLVSGFIGAAVFNMSDDSQTKKDPERIVEERSFVEESETINAIEKVVPAVVSVVATKDVNDPFFNDFFGRPQLRQQQQNPETERKRIGGGTGFIIQEDGLAITNKHVVNDTDADYSVLTNDGTEYDVEVIARDPVNDLAIIQLHIKKENENSKRKTGEERDFGRKPKDLAFLPLGDSSKIKVGQNVLAVGNARGEYANSVTSGIISAKGRDLQAGDQSGQFSETLTGLIQTDAAINFGNSGGPLVNLAGHVIGVNTAIDASANGIGFAIPIDQIKPALESVKKHGRIIRPILGVRHIILNKEIAKEMKLDNLEYGALITGDRSKKEFGVIPDSPADKAGLRIDDVILKVDGQEVTEDNALSTVVRSHVPGDVLTLQVWRAGKTLELKVTLEEFKEK